MCENLGSTTQTGRVKTQESRRAVDGDPRHTGGHHTGGYPRETDTLIQKLTLMFYNKFSSDSPHPLLQVGAPTSSCLLKADFSKQLLPALFSSLHASLPGKFHPLPWLRSWWLMSFTSPILFSGFTFSFNCFGISFKSLKDQLWHKLPQNLLWVIIPKCQITNQHLSYHICISLNFHSSSASQSLIYKPLSLHHFLFSKYPLSPFAYTFLQSFSYTLLFYLIDYFLALHGAGVQSECFRVKVKETEIMTCKEALSKSGVHRWVQGFPVSRHV